MSIIPAEQPRYEEMNSVVELYLKNYNETQIAKETGIKRKDVLTLLDDWRASARNLNMMQERIEELLNTTDQHYSKLIRAFYEVVEEVDKAEKKSPALLAQKTAALKSIAELERVRLDILQKSGFGESDLLGDRIAELEEREEKLLTIMQEELCHACKPRVLARYQTEARGEAVMTFDG